jgi:hypothetical protein
MTVLRLVPPLAGAPARPATQGCPPEVAAWWAGEAHSEAPANVSPVLASFARAWHDGLDDRRRQTLLRHASGLADTGGDADLDDLRRWAVLDWTVRTVLPAWLAEAGRPFHARRLRALPVITDATEPRSITTVLEADEAARDARAEVDGAIEAATDAALRGVLHDEAARFACRAQRTAGASAAAESLESFDPAIALPLFADATDVVRTAALRAGVRAGARSRLEAQQAVHRALGGVSDALFVTAHGLLERLLEPTR